MGFLWDFYWTFMKFLWNPYGHSYGSPVGFLWVSHRVSMIFLLDFNVISMKLLSDFYWIPVGFPWNQAIATVWCSGHILQSKQQVKNRHPYNVAFCFFWIGLALDLDPPPLSAGSLSVKSYWCVRCKSYTFLELGNIQAHISPSELPQS